MSATVDANMLLYGSDRASPFHEKAIAALNDLAGGPDLLYLFWPVLMSYLRISTHPAIFEDPLSPQEASDNVEQLLVLRHVRTPGEEEGFWELYRSVSGPAPVRGNLVSDAHIVTLMRQHGVTEIWSHDRDLRRFDDIRIRDPFA
ncbi:MAG: TA system VapC family ribonuclease toxin [Actinomycetota bacterium]